MAAQRHKVAPRLVFFPREQSRAPAFVPALLLYFTIQISTIHFLTLYDVEFAEGVTSRSREF